MAIFSLKFDSLYVLGMHAAKSSGGPRQRAAPATFFSAMVALYSKDVMDIMYI